MVRFITILNNNTRILSSSKVVRINKKTYQLFLFCVDYALISLWCLMENVFIDTFELQFRN